MSISDIQNNARQALHAHMARPASLYGADGNLVGLVTVRKIVKPKNVGDLAGTNLSYAEFSEAPTKLIFLVSEHSPARHEKVVLSATEGYFIDTVDPVDGLTQTVAVSEMSATELAGKTLPGDL